MTTTLKNIIISMRPAQWVKNLFVFAGLIFSKQLFHSPPFVTVSFGFMMFCLASSAIYIFNDIHDIGYDRRHPEKMKRPIAAGLLPVRIAGPMAFLMAVLCLAAGYIIHTELFLILVLYLMINVFYTVKLKHIVIVDVACIASGFVLRVYAGTALAGVEMTAWLYICTVTISLFLGFSKRRQELAVLGENAGNQRKVLSEYSISFLDQMINVATACTVMSYALYTISPVTVWRFGTDKLIYTVPFVLYGIFRYLYLSHKKELGGNPTAALLGDVPLVANALLWLGSVVLIIY